MFTMCEKPVMLVVMVIEKVQMFAHKNVLIQLSQRVAMPLDGPMAARKTPLSIDLPPDVLMVIGLKHVHLVSCRQTN